jgi:hypothetical protein
MRLVSTGIAGGLIVSLCLTLPLYLVGKTRFAPAWPSIPFEIGLIGLALAALITLASGYAGARWSWSGLFATCLMRGTVAGAIVGGRLGDYRLGRRRGGSPRTDLVAWAAQGRHRQPDADTSGRGGCADRLAADAVLGSSGHCQPGSWSFWEPIALVERDAQRLQAYTDLPSVAAAHRELVAAEQLEGPASAMLRSLSRVSQVSTPRFSKTACTIAGSLWGRSKIA